MIVVAPLSSKLVERLGTKRVVVAGMLVFAAGLVAGVDHHDDHRLPPTRRRHAAARGRARPVVGARHRVDHGIAATPPGRGRLGRQRHRPRSRRRARRRHRRQHHRRRSTAAASPASFPTGLPGPAAAAAHDSLGAALQVSGRLGAAGAHVADAAREAFVDAMSRASIVTAGVAAVGALVAWRYLPARGVDDSDNPDESSPEPIPTAPWYIVACTCSYGYGRICECTMTARDEQASCPCATAARGLARRRAHRQTRRPPIHVEPALSATDCTERPPR